MSAMSYRNVMLAPCQCSQAPRQCEASFDEELE